jgi:hypothetical protein
MALTKCRECGEQISTKAAACPKCGAAPKKKTSLFTWLVVAFIGFAVLGSITGKNNSGGSSAVSAPAAADPEHVALAATKLDFTWEKVGFDSVMEGNFTVTNGSQYTIKDITIECTHFAKSGTRIDSNERTIYDTVPAGKTKTFNKFNMGFIHSQANSTSCRITKVKV